MGVLAFFVSLLGLICLGVGIIISVIWISAAFATIYHTVGLQQNKNVEPSNV